MSDRPYWCEICARKKECYGITLKPKCFVPTADRKTEPTCSKMEQVDKDINVRSKDESTTQTETQNSNKNSNVISVYDGVSEAVRCAMCSNPNKSDRGCDGACSYDEKLYERIMKAIAESVADTPQTEIPNICEHIAEDGVTCAKYPACDDCIDNPLNKVKGSERLVKGSEQTEREGE